MLEVMPKWNELFKDVLQFFSDGNIYTRRKSVVEIADLLNLNPELRNERTEKTNVNKIENRIEFTLSALKRAGLLEQPQRSLYKISKSGRELLKNLPNILDEKYLIENYPQYRADVEKRKEIKEKNEQEDNFNLFSDTPIERMNDVFIEIEKSLSYDLMEQLFDVDPILFEKIVGDLLTKMGYGEFKMTPVSNDRGIDVIINEDKLGLDKILVQAKRFNKESKIGSPLIQNFLGALDTPKVQKGIFVTTSSFSENAIKVAENSTKKIRLIDGVELTKLMIEYNVGVETENIYEIKKINSDYFES